MKKAIATTWNSFTAIVEARPWLFIALVPIFCVTLPVTTNRPLFVIREINKLAPSEVRAEVSQFEPAADKLLRSVALAVIAVACLHVLESLRQKSFEEDRHDYQ
jgi:hypothetical protein